MKIELINYWAKYRCDIDWEFTLFSIRKAEIGHHKSQWLILIIFLNFGICTFKTIKK